MTQQTQSVLRSARSLLQRGFCTGHYALNRSRHPVGTLSSDAVSWCVAGAIDAVVKHDEVAFDNVWRWLQTTQFKPNTTSKDMIRYFDSMTQQRAVDFITTCLGETVVHVGKPGTKKTAIDITKLLR